MRVILVAVCALVACGGTQAPATITNAPQITLTKPSQVFGEGDMDFTFTVGGKFFSTHADGTGAPTVSLIRTRDLAGNPVEGPTFSTPTDPFGPAVDNQAVQPHLHPSGSGVYALSVKTPAGEARVEDYLLLFDRGTVTTVPDELMCLSNARTFTVQGTFNRFDSIQTNTIGAALPGGGVFQVDTDGNVVNFGPSLGATAQNCRTIPFAGHDASTCSQMTLQFGDQFTPLAPQTWKLNVSTGISEHLFDLMLEFAKPPASPRDIFVSSSPLAFFFEPNLVSGDGAAPSATLDGAPVTVTPATCRGGIKQKSLCRELDVAVPPGTAPGNHEVVITSASGCTSTGTLVTHAPPTINVSAGPHCVAGGAPVAVSGTSLFAPTAFVDGQPVPIAGCIDATCGTVSVSGLAPGDHQLVVRARLETTTLDTAPAPFSLGPGPATFGQPLPDTLLAGAQRQIFVPMSNKTGVATAAEFGAADGGVLTADFVDVDGGALVTTPADAGPGVYSVAVRDESPCSSGSPRRIELVSSPVLASYTFDVDRQNVAFTTLTSETGQPPVGSDSWSATAGNPGGAVIATAFGGPPQYFQLVNGSFAGDDLGVLRFDLNACPFAAGDPLPQAQVKLIGSTLNSRDFTLSRPFDSPACAYTHYDVPLGGDGWTYADASGSRPATALDFAQIFSEFLIQGNFFTVGNSVALDNVSLELGQ